MGALLERIASPVALADSWKRVLANDAEDDVLSAGVRRFAQDADNRLDELGRRLRSGGYEPAPWRASVSRKRTASNASCTFHP